MLPEAMEDLSLDTLKDGGKPALARALARLERTPEAPEVLALLDTAFAQPQARVIGVTGPPGVGKSTLLGALIAEFRRQDLTVGVIAVDPSSKRSGGALLGDRVRLAANPEDPGAFVRSMAARDRLGGLAVLTWAAMILMRALFDRVILETVGVGQSETDVAEAADSVVFCVQPGSGDALQFMKAGIVEIPDIAVVTKADMGPVAHRALADLTGALGLAPSETGRQVEALLVSAEERGGLHDLLEALDEHFLWLGQDGRLGRRRQAQAAQWLRESLRDRFGREGLRRLGQVNLPKGAAPFSKLAEMAAKLRGD